MKKIFDSIKYLQTAITYSLIVYCYSVAIHLFITIAFLDAVTWYSKIVSNPLSVLIFFVTLPIIFTSLLLYGEVTKKRIYIKIGLGWAWIYHFTLSALNLVLYAAAGTPWLPALFVGSIALILYLHYMALD